MAGRPAWSRLIRFISKEDGPDVLYGEPVGEGDVGLAAVNGTLQARVIQGDPLRDGHVTGRIVHVDKLLSPLPHDQVGAARCLGANYGAKRTPVPILFLKPQASLSHPSSPIKVPPSREAETDFENELVVVIGRTCKDVSPEDALDYVAGYTLCNDVTARKSMTAGKQWGMGKSLDTWLPFGPCIVSAARLTDPQGVQLTTFLNGKKLQDESTANQLWSVRETIAQLSIGTTLHTGSIICTGSPGGFGASLDPPVFLKHGDEVRCSGDRGLGTLVNRVDFESKQGLRSKL